MKGDARKTGRKVRSDIKSGAARIKAGAVRAVHKTEDRGSEMERRVKAAAHRANVKVRKAVRRR
jgi:hypothetical protein